MNEGVVTANPPSDTPMGDDVVSAATLTAAPREPPKSKKAAFCFNFR